MKCPNCTNGEVYTHVMGNAYLIGTCKVCDGSGSVPIPMPPKPQKTPGIKTFPPPSNNDFGKQLRRFLRRKNNSNES